MLNMKKLIVIIMIVMVMTDQITAKYGKYETSKTAKNESSKAKASSKGIGISAWGLVFLIVAGIIIGVAAYYIAIFYPLLCKKERKYDRIELAAI